MLINYGLNIMEFKQEGGAVMIEKSYVTIVEDIKEQIRSAQLKSISNANKEMLILYWNIGKVIDENSTWASNLICSSS